MKIATLVILLAFCAFAAPATQPPDVFQPNENLVVEGIPPIPSSLVEQVGRYTEFRAAAPLRLGSQTGPGRKANRGVGTP